MAKGTSAKTPANTQKASMITLLVGGFNPSEKICSSKWESSPNRGENEKYWKPPPRLKHDWEIHWTFGCLEVQPVFSLSVLVGGFIATHWGPEAVMHHDHRLVLDGSMLLWDSCFFPRKPHQIYSNRWCNHPSCPNITVSQQISTNINHPSCGWFITVVTWRVLFPQFHGVTWCL